MYQDENEDPKYLVDMTHGHRQYWKDLIEEVRKELAEEESNRVS